MTYKELSEKREAIALEVMELIREAKKTAYSNEKEHAALVAIVKMCQEYLGANTVIM